MRYRRRGGTEVRNFSQIFRSCFLVVHLACLLVSCVSPVQRCCSLRLYGTAIFFFLQFSRNFPQFFRNWI